MASTVPEEQASMSVKHDEENEDEENEEENPLRKVKISPDTTVTRDELADTSNSEDRKVPPEPYPSSAQTRDICRHIIRWSLVCDGIALVLFAALGAWEKGANGILGALVGIFTVVFFCLSTPAVMWFLARNRVNSKGRMKGYLLALGLSIMVKFAVFLLVWLLIIDDPRFSRSMFLVSALFAAISYLIVVAVVVVRSNRDRRTVREIKNRSAYPVRPRRREKKGDR